MKRYILRYDLNEDKIEYIREELDKIPQRKTDKNEKKQRQGK